MGTKAGRTASAWIRPLRHCWKPLAWFWVTILIVGVGVNVGSSWLISQHWEVDGTPLGWLIAHPVITLPLSGALLVFTSLSRLASVQAAKQTDEHEAKRSHLFPTLAQQNRTRMRQRLEQWYRDFLAASLEQFAWLDLDLADKPDALSNPVSFIVRDAQLPERQLPAGTSIVQVYDEAHQELLILGEPGSGKSTQLYTLGQHLLTLTESDQTAPLPIIFALSSWAQQRTPLETWMAEQLRLIYGISKRLAQQWVVNRQIIPLLDGLDEMEEHARVPCITAINTYHLAYLHPLVVCSRSAEYTTASHSERLALQRAVVVKPLTATQIEATLVKGGEALAGLREAYKHNRSLQELATSPLLLNLLILTYQNTAVRDLPTKAPALQQQVLEQYVTRMIKRKGDTNRYSQLRTCHWLSWLAHQMRLHNQTFFAVELLQPGWLARRWHLSYHWSIRLLFGLLGALSGTLSGALIGGLIGGLIGRLSGGLFGGLLGALNAPLSETLGLALIFALIFGRDNTITLVERMQWSWKEAYTGLISTLLFGLFFGLLFGLSVALLYGLLYGLLFGLFFGLLFGLSGGFEGLSLAQAIERHSLSPGEGLHRSLKSGLIFGLLGGLIGSLIGSLLFGGLIGRLSGGLFGGLIGSLIGGLFGGLSAFFQHLVLRFWLWRAGIFPFRAIAFLEDACSRHLLKRVGGTYQFMHRLLLDYFADSANVGLGEEMLLHSVENSIEAGINASTEKTAKKSLTKEGENIVFFIGFMAFQGIIPPILVAVLSQSVWIGVGTFLGQNILTVILISLFYYLTKNYEWDSVVGGFFISLPSNIMWSIAAWMIYSSWHVVWWLAVVLILVGVFFNFSIIIGV